MTDWGISLGPWNTPHTYTPSLLVATGARSLVWANLWLLSVTPMVLASRIASSLGANPIDSTTMSNTSSTISPSSLT